MAGTYFDRHARIEVKIARSRRNRETAGGRDMKYRHLGSSGLRVSEICLGMMLFGDRTSAAAANEIIAHAREHEVNFIDTANVYTSGRSEEIVGAAIARDRDRWILATKVGNPTDNFPNAGGLSRRHIIQACEESLRRLKTDYIDCYYLHREDHSTPLEETVLALGNLMQQGKIRYFGVSNHRSWRVAAICALCDEIGIDRPVVCQLYYHALNRTAEVELLPACHSFGIGTVAYSPLARGVLTGKYREGEAPEGSRASTGDRRILETEFHPANLAAARELLGRR